LNCDILDVLTICRPDHLLPVFFTGQGPHTVQNGDDRKGTHEQKKAERQTKPERFTQSGDLRQYACQGRRFTLASGLPGAYVMQSFHDHSPCSPCLEKCAWFALSIARDVPERIFRDNKMSRKPATHHYSVFKMIYKNSYPDSSGSDQIQLIDKMAHNAPPPMRHNGLLCVHFSPAPYSLPQQEE
jgi:hypothetical protein